MTKTPQWLPDGSGIDTDSLDSGMIVETNYGGLIPVDKLAPVNRQVIVRVYTDVTPPKPDPRVEVVARVLRKDGLFSPEQDARTILAALDAMDPDPEQRGR